MVRRRVIRSRKDKDGDITALCNYGSFWSPRSKDDVISDIECELYEYYVLVDGREIDLHVVKQSDGNKYLRTAPGDATADIFDNLPV